MDLKYFSFTFSQHLIALTKYINVYSYYKKNPLYTISV